MDRARKSLEYAVPTYEPPPEAAWYHFLHGNVPGHQIDFIYRPEVPHGRLAQQHFSHLARLVKYIEPRRGSAFAFAIGNLSRDDTQYEPGRGGVALIFGLRIRGVKDHTGRQDPPFCHAAAMIDRHLDAATIERAASALHDELLLGPRSGADASGFYHAYIERAGDRAALASLFQGYIRHFDALPAPGPSALGHRFSAREGAAPPRIVIVHGDEEPFGAIAACAARIAAVLIESDIRWTVISSGREADVPGGVSVRFVPAREAVSEAKGGVTWRLEDVPDELSVIARELFGAREAGAARAAEPAIGWRELYGKPVPGATTGRMEVETAGADEKGEDSSRKRQRSQVGALVGMGVVLAVGGAIAAAAWGAGKKEELVEERPAVTAIIAASPAATATAAATASATASAAATASASAAAPGSVPAKPSGKAPWKAKPAGSSVFRVVN